MLLPCPRQRATRQERLSFAAPTAGPTKVGTRAGCRSQALVYLFMHAWLVVFPERGKMKGQDPRA
jgi:hypothetical protein